MRPARFRLLAQVLGWYGVLALLGAYALISFEVLSADSAAYHILNVSGALGIVAVAISDGDLQPAVLNLVWAGVGLFALLRYAF